ncbi:MAG TPA: hypothetical protein VF784_12790 [Anaerolineales bacterium]
MRKLLTLVSAFVVVLGGLVGAAAPNMVASAGDCATYHVMLLNDVDSSTSGYWAMDTINRIVRVCPTATAGVWSYNTYDVGQFVSFAGNSPNGTGSIGDGITGTIKGGLSLLVTGSLNPNQANNIGTVDLACDHFGSCGSFSTLGAIFSPGYTYSYVDWGWTYTATCVDPPQVWVNSQSANTGDITAASCTN